MHNPDLTRGNRVSIARELTGLKRREFARRTGIANSTLHNWEQGLAFPDNSITLFINALLSLGVHCSRDWIVHGIDAPPQLINRATSTLKLTGEELADDKAVQIELDTFLKLHKNAITLVVPDDAMEPLFLNGQIVAGVSCYEKDMKKLIGMECIVLVKGDKSYVRTLLEGSIEGCYNLAPCNPKTTSKQAFFTNAELVSAAAIIWTRRKQPV